jgi:DNA-binding transcriptional regulator of glucitol operon
VPIRRFLAPKWLAAHVFVLAAAVTMVFLGRWQLNVSESKHFSLQNFGYALQWWAFSGFTVVMWIKILRDIARHDAEDEAAAAALAAGEEPPAPAVDETPRAYRSYSMPQSTAAPHEAGDSVHADYNAYLTRLAQQGDQ